MDLLETILQLQLEQQRIENAIARLKELNAGGGSDGLIKKRRGRKSMSLEERREVSARMKKYWANRRQHREGHEVAMAGGD